MTRVPTSTTGLGIGSRESGYPVFDIGSVESECFTQDLSDTAMGSMVDLAMKKVEVELAEAYLDGAAAVDVEWLHMGADHDRLFDVTVWDEDPPDEPESLTDRAVSRIERYDLTQTTDEEFEAAMDQSEIDFSRF